MKIQGSIVRQQTITGTITKAGLAELIDETLGIPPGAELRIYVKVPCGGDYSGMELDVGDNPEELDLQFTVSWSDAPKQG